MITVGIVDLSTVDEGDYRKLFSLASPERQQRATRYLRNEDARRCIIADGLLRYTLKEALRCNPVSLAKTPSGKPYVPGQKDFHFNLSHSGNWVVIAWGQHPLGIDVETVLMDESKLRLAKRFFHPEEQDHLFGAPPGEQAFRFFEIWTKKESYLKYQGTGIDRALNSFSVLQLTDVSFYTQSLEDAVLTLCARDTDCRMLRITSRMLLGE